MDKLIDNSYPTPKAPEKKDDKKTDDKKADAKVSDKKDDKKSLAQVRDYDIQNPTLKVVDKPSPVKTSIKGKGCTAENCDATRAPCCKVKSLA